MTTQPSASYQGYDVFLACAFEPEEGATEKFPLYNAIGSVVEDLGKRVFLPHAEIDLDWDPALIYHIIAEQAIPTADIVLGYTGLPSTAAGMMLERAAQSNRKIILLHEIEPVRVRAPNLVESIIFSGRADLVAKLRPALQRHLKR